MYYFLSFEYTLFTSTQFLEDSLSPKTFLIYDGQDGVSEMSLHDTVTDKYGTPGTHTAHEHTSHPPMLFKCQSPLCHSKSCEYHDITQRRARAQNEPVRLWDEITDSPHMASTPPSSLLYLSFSNSCQFYL